MPDRVKLTEAQIKKRIRYLVANEIRATREERRAFIAMVAICALLFLIAGLWPAHAASWPSRKVQKKCFVALTQMPDGKPKRVCLRLSKRLP